ncbi:MAG: hypothetical protein DVB26_01900 [Verrucomicrobia bacterium]|nr:MAG: hypothetical protein DVB26_01900 [Verrucomicrobiota bacterium]
MKNILTNCPIGLAQGLRSHGDLSLRGILKLTFIKGPKVLLTSQISVKCAAAMMLMCMPALLLCAILTLPALLFDSPQQNAYFYFAKVLEQDPTRWLVLLLTGLCVLLSLALPATMETPRQLPGY